MCSLLFDWLSVANHALKYFYSVFVVPHRTLMSNFSNDNSFTNSAARETSRSLSLCTHKIFWLELCHSCWMQLCSMFSLYGYIGENKMCRLTGLHRAGSASQRISENNGVFFHVPL